jgi:hypothetical protein
MFGEVRVRYVSAMVECTTCGTRRSEGAQCGGCGYVATAPVPGWYVYREGETLGPFATARQAVRHA